LRPAQNHFVKFFALALKIAPIQIVPDRFLDAARRLFGTGEAVHPDAIGPEQMIERRMDRAEEGAALALAVVIGQPVGAAVEVAVLPAVVVRHPLHVLPVDHSPVPPLRVAGARTHAPRAALSRALTCWIASRAAFHSASPHSRRS